MSALLAVSLAGAGAVAIGTPAAAATGGVLIYGLTAGETIVSFRAQTPQTLLSTSPAVGLAVGEDLVGIDVRPATGELYGVVNGPAADRLVVLSPASGAIVRSIPLVGVQLSGSSFGVDFNPVPDRLRIVSDAEQNLRVNPDTGAALNVTAPSTTPSVDGSLAYAASDTRTSTVPDVVAAAYTNNVAGALTTVLYDLDVAGQDALVRQDPPNAGTLNTVGLTGDNAATVTVGLDIEAVTNAAYAVFRHSPTAREALHRINLTTGAATPAASTLAASTFTSTSPVEDITVASARFSVGDATAAEGSAAQVVVTRTGDSADTATVNLVPAPGSATPGDFDPATRTVTFAAGATSATATVTVTSDTLVEPSETFTVGISSVVGGGGNEAATARRGTVTITDGPAVNPICATPAQVVLARNTINATGSAGVSVTGPAGTVVELFAYTRPSTTYRVVRTGTVPASGTLVFPALRPPANTRLYAQTVGCTANIGADSKVLNVRTTLSLFALRNGPRNYTFTGDSLPARPGGLIVSLYRVTASGSQVLTSQVRANARTGDWVINRRFTGTGRFGFVVRTGQDLQNAPGASNTRPTLIY